MNFEESVIELTRVIPFKMPQEFLEEIVLNSSAIIFSKPFEVLFKRGDHALGFYWLLKGRVVLQGTDERILCEYHAGGMVGLDNFLNKEIHRFNIITIDPEVSTLFVDRRCYEQMMQNSRFQGFLNKQLLWQLKSLKSAI